MTPLTLVHSDSDHARRDVEAGDLFVSHLETIRAAITFVVRRQRLTPEEREDFTSAVMVRLLENDCAILRKFQGRSSFKTYITIVVQRLFLDFRDAQWGKWRPSSRALRHGRPGVLLEMLTMKRGMTFEQAYRLLQAKYKCEATRETLEGVHEELPPRTRRRFVGDEALADVAAEGGDPEADVVGLELRAVALRICAALEVGVSGMTTQEQALLRMRYQRNLSVATIARQLSMDQKALYRRYEQLLAKLRDRLKQDGISRSQLLDVLGRAEIELPAVIQALETSVPAPSDRCA